MLSVRKATKAQIAAEAGLHASFNHDNVACAPTATDFWADLRHVQQERFQRVARVLEREVPEGETFGHFKKKT